MDLWKIEREGRDKMNGKPTKQLTSVQQGSEDFEISYILGRSPCFGVPEVCRIEMVTDGHGPMGYYDVIYIYLTGLNTHFAALPAHMCNEWKFLILPEKAT